MWVLVNEGVAWQITSDDPTGLWGENFIWVDIGNNPDGVQEQWIATQTKGKWNFKPWTPAPLSDAERLLVNQKKQADLMAKVSSDMTPLLVSLQLGDATQEETDTARALQQYYRDLKALDVSSVMVWPELTI